MPLEPIAIAVNNKHLDSLFAPITTEQNREKSLSIRKQIDTILQSKEIQLYVEAGIKSLKTLIETALEIEDLENLAEQLENWAKNYQKLVEQVETIALSHAQTQLRDIYDAISHQDLNAMESRWGSERDLKIVLQGVIKSTFDVSEATEILLPVSLEAAKHGNEGEKLEGSEGLIKDIHHVMEKNLPEITLISPVSCKYNHWRLAIVKLENNVITEAELWDPQRISTWALKESDAYKNMQLAVNKINDNKNAVTVKATSGAVQYNGHSCMDYVVQHALLHKYPKPATKKFTLFTPQQEELYSNVVEPLRHVLLNTKEDALRDAIIGLIINHTPTFKDIDVKKLRKSAMEEMKKKKESIPFLDPVCVEIEDELALDYRFLKI